MIEKIKSQDLATYIGGEQEKVGRNIRVNPCPICGHKDCFTIYPESNTYHCFSCGKSGSIIDYVIDMKLAREVNGAVEVLAKHYGWDKELEERKRSTTNGTNKKGTNGTNKEGKEEREKIEKVHQIALEYYHKQLLGDKKALAYLTEKRGRSLEMIEEQMYGYAPTHYGLTAVLSEKKIPMQVQIASGLVLPGKDAEDRPHDLFGNGMILYPSFIRNQPCDWTGKPIDKTKNPYRLRVDYRLRNCIFYGQDSLYRDELVLVEGQEDRNSILELGNYAAVSILGGLGDDQILLLKERTEGAKVYLCMDSDPQGQKYIDKLIRALAGPAQVHIIDFGNGVKDIDDWLRAIPINERKGCWDELMSKALDPISWLLQKIPQEELNPYQMNIFIKPIVEIIAQEQDQFLRAAYMSAMDKQMKNRPKISAAITRAVRELINKEKDPVPIDDEEYQRSVSRKGTQYYKFVGKDSMKVISDFVFTIHRYIEDDGVRYYEVTLHTYAGSSKPIVLSNEQRINMKMFDAALAGMGPYYFYGTLNDLKEVWQLEEERADIKSYTCRFNRYGWIADHKIWLFKNCAYKNGKMYLPEPEQDVIVIDGIGYQSKNVRVFGGDVPELNITERPSAEYVQRAAQLVWQMWDSGRNGGTPGTFKGFLAMGFLAACVYLQEITDKENKFPYLLAFGPPGTGKSEAMQFIMNMWGFRNGGENWGEATPAGISMAMEQLSSIPYWIEEFSNTMGASTNQQRKVELLKNVYNRVSAGKGGINGRTVYQVNAALFLTGQDRPENQALLSRCVVLRKEMPTDKGSEGYFLLKAEGKRLTLVLRWLLENKNAESIKQFWDNYEQLLGALKVRIKEKVGDYNERTTVNYALIATGFSMLGYHDKDAEFLAWLVDECVTDMNRKQAEDIVYRFFSDIESIFHDELINVITRTETEIYLYYTYIYNEWVKNLRSTGMQEYIGREGLLDYLRKDTHEYWIQPMEKEGMHRRYFGHGANTKQARCIGVRLDRLPAHIKDIVEGWDIPVGT